MFQNRKECYWVTHYKKKKEKKKHHQAIRRARVLVRALVAKNEMVQRTAPPLLSLARQEEDRRADF
jgi:hypothetical protein